MNVIHLVRCACGVVGADRSLLPEPCRLHGEVKTFDVVPAAQLVAIREIATDFGRSDEEAIRDIVALTDGAAS